MSSSQAIVERDVQTETESDRTNVFDAIRERRSIGRVTQERPPRELIEKILEAATWAPNHHVTEPWRFAVFTGEARAELGDVMARSKVERMKAQGRGVEGEFERAAMKALRAPVIIAVIVEPDAGPKTVVMEEVLAGAAAIQNMLLTAHALGLGAIWRTGDPAFDPMVKVYLGVEPSAHIVGFVYLGYPDAAPRRVRHTPADAMTTWVGWDGPAV
jgi:nitroreductase